MSIFHTKPLEVQAVQFLQHRKPWPQVVEAVYANGIPEPRLEGGTVVVRNLDYIVSVGPALFTLPPNVFKYLFGEGPLNEPNIMLSPDNFETPPAAKVEPGDDPALASEDVHPFDTIDKEKS